MLGNVLQSELLAEMMTFVPVGGPLQSRLWETTGYRLGLMTGRTLVPRLRSKYRRGSRRYSRGHIFPVVAWPPACSADRLRGRNSGASRY